MTSLSFGRWILTPGLNFKDNTSWRFVQKDYVFPNAGKPCGYPEITVFNQTGVLNYANFLGVKIGDVSGDALANTVLNSDTRNAVGDLIIETSDISIAKGERLFITLAAANFEGIQGYQFTLGVKDGSAL